MTAARRKTTGSRTATGRTGRKTARRTAARKASAPGKLPRPPKFHERFTRMFPEVAQTYSAMGDAVHGAGPLDDHTRALVKLAISVGAGFEGGVHAHTRKALAVGVSPAEIRHLVLMALPTIGFPPMMARMSWVNDVLEK